MTNNKLSQAAIEDAFRLAQSRLGTAWQLKGKGHCYRATLLSHVSRAAAKGADKSYQEVRLKIYDLKYSRVFPLDLVEEAARKRIWSSLILRSFREFIISHCEP